MRALVRGSSLRERAEGEETLEAPVPSAAPPWAGARREKREEPNMTDKKTIYDEAREMLEHAAAGADEDEAVGACDGAQEGEDGDMGMEEFEHLFSLAGAFIRDSSALAVLASADGLRAITETAAKVVTRDAEALSEWALGGDHDNYDVIACLEIEAMACTAVKALNAGRGAAAAAILGEAGMKVSELVGANLVAAFR